MTRSVLRYRGQLAARNTHRDELHLLGFPIVPGRGKRLLAAPAAVETGVLNLTYARTRPLAVPGPAR